MNRRVLLVLIIALPVALLLLGLTAFRGGSDADGEGEAASSSVAESVEPADPDVPLDDKPSADLVAGWRTDFSKHSVPFSEILSGGPPKDGIPALDVPRFQPVGETEFLGDSEPLIAVEIEGEVRAYPLQILIWHEIVNDRLGDVPIAVTFCPLCNTAVVFDRRLEGQVLDFGTSGNLRNSDLLMYDRQTETWWQQFSGEGIVGELTGKELTQVPARIVSWADFKQQYPDAEVLSKDTGFGRSYGLNPYTGYDDVNSPPFFSAANSDDDRLPPKERVVLIDRGDETVVVPFSALEKKKTIEIDVGGETLAVTWKPGVSSALDEGAISSGRDVGSAEVRLNGELVAFDQPFWFAVAAFRPDARIVR